MNTEERLLADGGGEWFLYLTPDGRYIVRYTREFYMNRAGLLPAFNTADMQMEQEVSPEEAYEVWLDIKEYYGSGAVDCSAFDDKGR